MKRKRSNGSWEYRFVKKDVLPKPVSMTFLSENEGDKFARYVESMLAAGIVPPELKNVEKLKKMRNLIFEYIGSQFASTNDKREIAGIQKNITSDTPAIVNYEWVENWIAKLKEKYKPSSVSKKVTVMRRLYTWAIKTDHVAISQNPFTMIPRNYAGTKAERDRRLQPGEEERIREVLTPWEELLFDMALETAMRMSEMLHLRWSEINLPRRTILLLRTKNGRKRQVPISTVLLKKLEAVQTAQPPYEDAGTEYVFPFNKGGTIKREALAAATSMRFKRRFTEAGVDDFHFHDLRHEAISRLYERTNMTDLEISKISGHRSLGQLARYANLRPSDLAEKMW